MSEQSQILNTYRITEPTWFPAEEAITGTVSTQSTLVTSIGGNFRTDGVSENDWLVNKDGNVARKILRIYSETQLEIESAFPADLPGATVVLVRDKAMRYLRVIFTVNEGYIRSAAQSTNSLWPYAESWASPETGDFLTPQLVTPGSGGASVIMGV